MLKEITIKNLRSFNEEVTFTMEADYKRVSEFKNHIVNICNNNLLKVASVYGPNGGGKSNLIKALTLPRALMVMSDDIRFKPNEIKCVFSDEDEIEETLFFVTDEYEIGLNFVISSDITGFESILDNQKKINYKHNINIIKESVVYRLKDDEQFNLLYERDNTGAVQSKVFENLGVRVPNLSKSKMFLSKIYDEYANNDYISSIHIDIIKKLYLEILLMIPLDDNHHIWFENKESKAVIEKNKNKLVKLLNSVDIKISNINLYEDRPNTIYFERIIECKGEKKTREIPLTEESEGTKKIFNIFFKLLLSSRFNVIFYCDDMNSFLHPKLFRAIIEFFNSQDNKNQLIFNSHDITNMNNELFRRDEIWFAYRDENYSTKLTPLSNIVNYKGEQIRNDAKYNKQYLEGRYGADPFIQKGLNWYEEI